MTIRDVRLHWPRAEKALAEVGEILVTRDGRPVARLLPYREKAAKRRRSFEPGRQLGWLSRFWKGAKAGPKTDELLATDRDDRP
jgi:antitoxin (DNA-binding transcriptional repressor) of toxin-antitoxin stability system